MAQNGNESLENLFRHTIELNKKYMSQGFKVMNEVMRQNEPGRKPLTFRPELYSRTFNAFAKMNLEYYNGVMQLGLNLADEIISGSTAPATPAPEPAFELEGSGRAGEKVSLEFMLENTQEELAECKLLSSPFVDFEGKEVVPAVTTRFEPQSFTQESGETNTITILLQLHKNMPPGQYICKVAVEGYSPSFFTILLNVEPPVTKPSNAKTKKRSTKKG